MNTFAYPDYINPSVVSSLENAVIEICNSCHNFDQFKTDADPLWQWAGQVLHKSTEELRREVETHSTDEHFSDPYQEEKDHLLKLPLILLEEINHH